MSCDSPYYVKNPRPWTGDAEIPVPCGRCPKCIKRRINGWVFRLLQEEKRSTSSYFITLTYDTNHVPISRNSFMSLNRNDLTKFWKKLRKTQQQKIRYYAVGEYGTNTKRPHYHAIVFNVEDVEEFQNCWNLGAVHIGKVTGDSIGYTCSYINKGKTIPAHARDDRVKEYSVMSKNLGSNYLTPEIIAYHKADVSRNYVTLPGGVKAALPRYYREQIYNSNEKAHQRELIEKSYEESDDQLYRQWLKRYPDGDITFEYYKDQSRYARFKKFHSLSQKSKRSTI